MQQPAALNSYSPGVVAANHTSLTVRTSGLSPANSMHSPAGKNAMSKAFLPQNLCHALMRSYQLHNCFLKAPWFCSVVL